MQLVATGETFNGCDLIAFVRHRQREARIDAAPVYQHGARAALAVIASFFRAGELQPLAQSIEQCDAGIDVERILLAVNL